MNLSLVLRTIQHLRPMQVLFQIKYRIHKPKFQWQDAPQRKMEYKEVKVAPIPRFHSLECGVFTFLNLSHEFSGWEFNEYGNLWTYNQNYFDWLNQDGMSSAEGGRWIDRFIDEVLACPVKQSMALDPYPIALRNINWIKFFCRNPEMVTKRRLDALWSQVALLEKKLEWHLMANHLLEDAFSLYVAGSFFGNAPLIQKATKLLFKQLEEQVLPDGAHYEQSVMYHCILIDRLLDCINIGERFAQNVASLRNYAQRMLGHLDSICYSDGSIPLLNDAAKGIAPMPAQIFDYARRLGIEWTLIPMRECGYRRLTTRGFEVTVDVGNITASYQPGHTHADVLSYEFHKGGHPVVVDTGISTYEKNARRQIERSSISHNVVVVDGRNSYEVWDGFRVGRRAKVEITELERNVVEAWHDGYEKPCKRRFSLSDKGLVIEDWYNGEAIGYIHLAENVDPQCIKFEDAESLEIYPWNYSTEYNRFHVGTAIAVRFKDHLKYLIQ